MKLIIAGSRTVTDMVHLKAAFAASGFDVLEISEVVSGCAKGVDTLGEEWAKENGIPVTQMPPEWLDRHAIKDKGAGRRRNVSMAKYAHAEKDGALLAVMEYYGTPGTKHMINAATSRGLKVYVHKV